MTAESKIFPSHRSHKTAEELKEGFETFDPRFGALLPDNPTLVHHWRGAEWTEGTVYLPGQKVVLFSDIPNDRMLQFDPATGEMSVFREPANFTNGHYVDLEGRLVSAQHLTHGITRTEHDGNVEMLVDRFEGKRLNSPNDLVVKSDGTIWFTDPPYGILSDREGEKRDSEVGGNFVFRFDPDSGDLSIVMDSMDRPNGIAFSPDESILYVADTGEPKNVLAFDVASDGRSLSNKREFLVVRPGASDGFRCDVEGNIWTSAGDGVHCYTSEAELIGKILVPEQAVANCCFGGEDFRTLYIAGDTSLYSAELAVAGARPAV
jgi:gluconolactonase